MTHYIQDYIDLVRSGTVPVCREQILLVDLVERTFQQESIYVDEEQLARYMDQQKYFPYKLLEWETFCFALHNCVYKAPGRLRWPILMIVVGRGAGKNGYLAFEDFGSGLPSAKIDRVVGVVKAYSTCVGEGPFVCEMFGEEAELLREAGGEYGAKTGRPRRVGPIDLVATRYGVEVQSATEIALTKLDVLSYMDKIPVCSHYELSGEKTDQFPFPAALAGAKPVIEWMDGWMCDLSDIRKWNELPLAARRYVEAIEEAIHCPITYVSVGPERDSIIIRK